MILIQNKVFNCIQTSLISFQIFGIFKNLTLIIVFGVLINRDHDDLDKCSFGEIKINILYIFLKIYHYINNFCIYI